MFSRSIQLSTLAIAMGLLPAMHASPFPGLPRTNPDCVWNDVGGSTGGTCVGGATVIGAGPGNISGVALFNTGTPSFLGGGMAELTLSSSGSITTAVPSGATFPVSYDFNLGFLSGDDGATVSSWTLDLQILDGETLVGDSGTIDSGAINNTEINSGGEEFIGSSSVTLTSAILDGDPVTVQGILDVTWSQGSGDTLTIKVPGATSFDLEPASAVPEPGSIALTASGIALAALGLRRRRSSQPQQ